MRARTPSSTADVPLHHRGVLDPELPGQVLHHRPRHSERIVHPEQPDVANGAHLDGEAELMRGRASERDQIPVDVVQEEEPLKLGSGRLLGELSVRLGLFVSQEFHGHERNIAPRSSAHTIIRRSPADTRTLCYQTKIVLGANGCTTTTRPRTPPAGATGATSTQFSLAVRLLGVPLTSSEPTDK